MDISFSPPKPFPIFITDSLDLQIQASSACIKHRSPMKYFSIALSFKQDRARN